MECDTKIMRFYIIFSFFLLSSNICLSQNAFLVKLRPFTSFEEASSNAIKSNKLVFIFFTCRYCQNGHLSEEQTLSQEQVIKKLSKLVCSKLDALDEKNKILQKRKFNEIDQPQFIIYNPRKDIYKSLTGYTKTTEFLNFLDYSIKEIE